MAPSKKNASDIDSDIDSDVQDDVLPPTNEDTFNNIFRGATTLPPRIRNKPQRHCASPTPPLTSKKKNTKKKKPAPLVNSSRTNQSNNNNNTSKMKKRTRKSSNASIAPAPLSSVAPLSSLATNVLPVQLPGQLSTSVPNGALLS